MVDLLRYDSKNKRMGAQGDMKLLSLRLKYFMNEQATLVEKNPKTQAAIQSFNACRASQYNQTYMVDVQGAGNKKDYTAVFVSIDTQTDQVNFFKMKCQDDGVVLGFKALQEDELTDAAKHEIQAIIDNIELTPSNKKDEIKAVEDEKPNSPTR